MTHQHPGAVKITIGEQDFYHQPLLSFCMDRGCRVYSWDDPERDGFWIQHGDNREAARFFPRRLPSSISPYRMIAVRPDVLEWVIACHEYEDR